MATLLDIKNKVRRITKMPSTNQLSDANLLVYINTFLTEDLPNTIQVFDLNKTIKFATTPYVDTYSTTTGNFDLNLKNFKDYIISIDQPIFSSGDKIFFSQSPDEFYNIYPKNKLSGTIGTGDGATVNFTYTLPNKVLHNSVIIGTLNAAGEALIVRDLPNTDSFGREANAGTLRDQANNNLGTIDYLTGEIDVTFGAAPKDSESITYEFDAYSYSQPEGMLYYDNKLTLRPVPNQVYEIEFQARIRPDALVNNTDTPLIESWWQYIAYGAAKKIFEDLSNMEGVQMIMPEFERQRDLVCTKSDLIRYKEAPGTIFNTIVTPYPYNWYYHG